jgi:hypothetical protein
MASASSSLGSTAVSSKLTKRHAARITSSTERSNAASLTFDGLVNPLRYGTNRMANASISSFVAGGSKLTRVLMFRHFEISS